LFFVCFLLEEAPYGRLRHLVVNNKVSEWSFSVPEQQSRREDFWGVSPTRACLNLNLQ
jgi:hypothetical protein